MIGTNITHDNTLFVTHTNLAEEETAMETTTAEQRLWLFFGLIIVLGLLALFPHNAAVVFVAVLSGAYFMDMLFNLFLLNKSLNQNPEIVIRNSELTALDEDKLPLYTILCPLYKEEQVLEQFVNAMENLDWPKDKLEVILLFEEDDIKTISKAFHIDLPEYVRILIVPDSKPKTKPKACNYGLCNANGQYLVVYDAEDIPEPQQLKKAYAAFQKLGENVVCLQAKLNFFNPEQNLLTRMFTAEYSLWFDMILPGLQAIKSYIPLGGTSNHFRTKDLFKLKGWDPFNVTEDCDLGARIFNSGYQTAIFDSTTLEEANSDLRNWLRQRSRWIKGYMQTYLVHMRHPVMLFKKMGYNALLFQLVIGARVLFLVINPILWLMTLAYFILHPLAGPFIESLYPDPVLYIAVTSLVIGNFLYFYYYMLGCARRNQWYLIKYVFLVPVYWFMGSVSALIAFYQLLVKPHYWEKTNHGFAFTKFPKLSSETGL